MAEFDIGKQCSISSCKQLDFLPFTCNKCFRIFCLEHRSTTSHNCPAETENVDSEQRSKKETSVKIQCCFADCDASELLPIKCDFCEEHFCLRHRHQQDHGCSKIEAESSVKDDKEKLSIAKKEKTGYGGMKNQSRAAKVALMKMKTRAIGEQSIPQTERVYFSIKLPAESSEDRKPMFFSKKWTMGRIIDDIAKLCKLRNENNRKLSKKLRLFDGVTKKQLVLGNSLEREMNENAETMLNGSELVLEYVQES